MAWTSASFAFLADLAMGTLGGDLKRKEKLTGRFADIFMWMCLGTATLVRFEAEGRRPPDLPYVRWAMEHAFARIQDAFDGLYDNLEVPGATCIFRGPIAGWSRINRLASYPSDHLGHEVAQALQVPGEPCDRLTEGMFVPKDVEEPLGRLENALELAVRAERVERTLKDAVRAGRLPRKVAPTKLVKRALELGLISQADAELLEQAAEARQDAMAVDSFTLEEYSGPKRAR